MAVIDNIKQQQLQARKQRDTNKVNTLTTLLNEVLTIGKNDGNRQPTDAECYQVIKKMINNAQEVINIATRFNQSEKAEFSVQEKNLLNQLLPTQLTEEQLNQEIVNIVTSFDKKPNIGQIMSVLKTKFQGMYDGSLANKLIKQQLS